MKTVLIIDDDPTILDLFSTYLTQEGFRTVTAPNGRSGLEAFRFDRPDAVLCDLSMPGLGGLEVLAEVKKESPFTPFVIISGTHDLGDAIEALREGAWDFLIKPLPGLEILVPLLGRMEERAVFLREKELRQAQLEEQVRTRTAQLVRQLHEKDLLLAEVHHRVKNNLQIILVLLGLQQDHSGDPAVREALEATQNRIHALAMVQEAMHDVDHAPQVGARNYGTDLVNHLLSVHGLTTQVNLTLELEDLVLPPGMAFTCGLVMNELMAAIAQASPEPGPWNLMFGLRASGYGGVELTVVESRGTWARWVPAPGRRSTGWELVSALAAQGGGSLAWNPRDPHTVKVRLV